MIRSSNPGGGRRFSFHTKLPGLPWYPPSLLLNGKRGSLPAIRWQRRDIDHSSPSNTEVKSAWSYSFPLYALMAWTMTAVFFKFINCLASAFERSGQRKYVISCSSRFVSKLEILRERSLFTVVFCTLD